MKSFLSRFKQTTESQSDIESLRDAIVAEFERVNATLLSSFSQTTDEIILDFWSQGKTVVFYGANLKASTQVTIGGILQTNKEISPKAPNTLYVTTTLPQGSYEFSIANFTNLINIK